VLVARNNQAQYLAAEAPAGAQILIRLPLTPSWAGMTDGLGGGPLIVKGGKPVFRANEAFDATRLNSRDSRSAVGQLADGRVVLVVVDGNQPGYSAGMTNLELAVLLSRLGAVTGAALDSGGSATMAFAGQLLSRPSDAAG